MRANLTSVSSPQNPTIGGSRIIFSVTFSYFLFIFYLPWSTIPDFPCIFPGFLVVITTTTNRFVAEHYLSLLPGSGLEFIALVLCFLREEISDMRKEINTLREPNSKNEKSFEDMSTVKQDVADSDFITG